MVIQRHEMLGNVKNVIFTEPLDALAMHNLMKRAVTKLQGIIACKNMEYRVK